MQLTFSEIDKEKKKACINNLLDKVNIFFKQNFKQTHT